MAYFGFLALSLKFHWLSSCMTPYEQDVKWEVPLSASSRCTHLIWTINTEYLHCLVHNCATAIATSFLSVMPCAEVAHRPIKDSYQTKMHLLRLYESLLLLGMCRKYFPCSTMSGTQGHFFHGSSLMITIIGWMHFFP